MNAVVVFAHGSSVAAANDGVRALTAELGRRGQYELIETAFLELAQPDLPAAVACLSARGATRIVIVPFFLTLGIHLRRDLPGIVEGLRGIHPSMEFEIAPPLEGHPSLVDVMLGRAEEALGKHAGKAD